MGDPISKTAAGVGIRNQLATKAGPGATADALRSGISTTAQAAPPQQSGIRRKSDILREQATAGASPASPNIPTSQSTPAATPNSADPLSPRMGKRRASENSKYADKTHPNLRRSDTGGITM